MITLNFKQSVLIMLLKSAKFKEEIGTIKRAGKQHETLKSVDCLLDYYTKYYNSLETIQYEFIYNFFVKELGNLLFHIDPTLYKRAIEKSLGVADGCYDKRDTLQTIIVELMLLDMGDIRLNEDIGSVLTSHYIPEIRDWKENA